MRPGPVTDDDLHGSLAPRAIRRPRVDSAWTDQRVDRLKSLWAAGEHSCAAIAAELGGGLSRNAVIGKALRLGLTNKRHIYPKTTAPKRPRVARTIQANGRGFINTADDRLLIETDISSIAELEAQPRPATFLGVTLLNLEQHHCRYPRDIDGVRLFCGQPKIEGGSYCLDCHRRCTSRFGHRNVPAEIKEARLRGMKRTMAERARAAA